MFGKRKDVVFKELKGLLEPFKIDRYYTDDWGAYERHIDSEKHEVGNAENQGVCHRHTSWRYKEIAVRCV